MSGTRSSESPRVAVLLATIALAGAALSGCSALGGISGAVVGAGAGTASGNPGVGIAVAIAVKTAIDAVQRKFDRYWQREEQDSIAAQIGTLDVGAQGPWQVRHVVPYEDKQGQVRVLRAFSTPLADCKEALFTVEDDPDAAPAESEPPQPAPPPQPPQQYLTTVCKNGEGWRWALAEPAVPRWGTLH